jgi:hypothetical protein
VKQKIQESVENPEIHISLVLIYSAQAAMAQEDTVTPGHVLLSGLVTLLRERIP